MKDEVENLLKLRNSQFIKKTFKKNILGNKTDFENVCGFKNRNKNFRKWIDILVEEGCIEKMETDPIRGDLFIVNNSKIRNRLMTLPLYRLFGKYYEDFLP